jgi:TldD protein
MQTFTEKILNPVMTEPSVKHFLLEQVQLNLDDLDHTLGLLHAHDIDFGDVYLQYTASESWALEDGIVKEGSFSIDKGVGIRAVSEDKSGFAYADFINKQALVSCAKTARNIVMQGQSLKTKLTAPLAVKKLYTDVNPLKAMAASEKVALLKEIDVLARSLDPRVRQVMASLSSVYEVVLIAASDGTYAEDIRPLVRINVSVIAEENGRREQGFSGGGGRYTFQELLKNRPYDYFVREAVRTALVNLSARAAPAGVFDIVLAAGWPGVLIHEAVGHGLEGDFNRKESSSFAHKMNDMVASELCTIVDDGTLAGRRGSLTIDDEGNPTQYNVLIEKGRLKNYLFDKLNGKLMKAKSSGNGRRESYAYLPMPRMTNTYMLAGTSTKDEILASIDKGIYAVNFSGGQVDITSGKFVFVASEAYWIEKGKIQYPIKGMTLIGDGPSALKRISMVGNDLQLDEGVGVCGKEGQSIPVGVGQPTLRINQMTVGGTANSN